jgi:hypothetical protein
LEWRQRSASDLLAQKLDVNALGWRVNLLSDFGH